MSQPGSMRAQAEGTPGISRRTFLGAGLTALVTVAFLDTLAASKAIPSSVEPILAGWLRRLHRQCADCVAASSQPVSGRAKSRRSPRRIRGSEPLYEGLPARRGAHADPIPHRALSILPKPLRQVEQGAR